MSHYCSRGLFAGRPELLFSGAALRPLSRSVYASQGHCPIQTGILTDPG